MNAGKKRVIRHPTRQYHKGTGGKSYGVATVTVVDNCGDPAAQVEVSGTFTGDFDETESGVTDVDGVVILQTSTQIKKPKFGFIVDALERLPE